MTLFKLSFPTCHTCGKHVRIVRRGVRLDEGGYFEQQEFLCSRCNIRMQRKVNTNGTVRDGNALRNKVQHEASP